MNSKKIYQIGVEVADSGNIIVDLGGEWDNACCGSEAAKLNAELKELGVLMELEGVHCRLPVLDRFKSKLRNECNTSPLKEDQSLERRQE